DVEAALRGEAVGRWRRASRLDEHRDGDQAIRINEVRNSARVLHAPETIDDLHEPGRYPGDDPARLFAFRLHLARLPDLPAGRRRRPRRLDHLRIDLRADRHFAENELLEHAVVLVDHARLEDQPGCEVGPELVTVAQAVLRLEHPRLRVESGDAHGLGLAEIVEL